MILAGDVGGTKVNLALFRVEKERLVPCVVKSYPSHEYSSLVDVISALLKDSREPVTAAAFGIAGPVDEGKARLTNLGWEVVAGDIARHLNLPAVRLLNDLEATAYGTQHLSESDVLVLQRGEPRRHAPIAVIAAGTGLGEGGLVWDGRHYRALPSEGGHADFAPRNAVEVDLLRFMLARFDHVSCERLVSGPGIVEIYDFHRSRAACEEPAWLKERLAAEDPAAAISAAAMEGADDVCVKTLDTFVSLYGAEAGNLTLKLLARGGLYVGGGIAPKIQKTMQQGGFTAAFVDKGRYRALLEQIPVYLILNQLTALLGAAHSALIPHD